MSAVAEITNGKAQSNGTVNRVNSYLTDEVIEAVVWHALAKSPETNDKGMICRQYLKDGQKNEVSLQVEGKVDGHDVHFGIRGILSVGNGRSNQKPTHAPYKNILEHVLGKLNSTTRESILRDLPNEFEENGREWPKDIGLQAEIKDMIDRLKEKMPTTEVRGSVTWKGVKI